MQLLALTDIHGRQALSTTLREKIRISDLITISGDLTDFGGEEEAKEVLTNLKQENEHIIAVPGNCDTYGVNEILSASQMNIHGEIVMHMNIAFMGIGGCSKTPFGTPQEYSESDIKDLLHGFSKQDDARFHVLVSHAPPSGTRVDRTFMGLHVGSKALRDFIESFQPDLVLCGHIHEACGVDKIGRSIVINPGPFPKHYAEIHFTDHIEYTLCES